ncbi:MAG TPA: hypothetical protein VJK03_00795 [Candidatus Nanoarchaeia archaeon]|nr:hypothetical protein [Candidatus Nanoarchaeia archaeon]
MTYSEKIQSRREWKASGNLNGEKMCSIGISRGSDIGEYLQCRISGRLIVMKRDIDRGYYDFSIRKTNATFASLVSIIDNFYKNECFSFVQEASGSRKDFESRQYRHASGSQAGVIMNMVITQADFFVTFEETSHQRKIRVLLKRKTL